tara:strand:+ start:2063 stop:3385 length:1323 start_codon:yes stop_codon:yes gene_type:complete
MKSFLQFISESTAVQQAKRMGLVGDGHGGWYDKQGEFVAKTEGGKLKFYNKRQRQGQDPPQSEKEKNLSTSSSEPAQGKEQPAAPAAAPAPVPQQAAATQQEPVQQGEEDPNAPALLEPEPVEKTKGTLTIAFGRFNPPTIGHEKLLNQVAASADNEDYIIVPSRSQDTKKNPLDPESKVETMKAMFPNHSDKIVNDPGSRTIFDVLKKAHSDGYAGVRLVVGGDRQKEFDKLTSTYNGKMYQFDNLEVQSAGDRDDESEDPIEAMSASVQRKHVANGDFNAFFGNLHRPVETFDADNKPVEELQPIIDEKKAKELYLKLRASMNVKEGNLWQLGYKLDWKTLRENYINEKIFNIGQLVENLNTGLVGRIIRRGANHLICVTEDRLMFKSWIKDVTEHTKVSGVPADQRLVGTDSLRKYTENLVPGSTWGKQFINKYRKK